MPKKQKTTTQILMPDKNRCRFTTIDGRQCRMYRAKHHKTLCLTHAQQEQQLIDSEAVAAELIGPLTKFQTALEVNHTLGNLYTLIAQKRISRHDGALLGFVGQVLLHSVGSTVKSEFERAEGSQTPPYWENNVRRALARLQDPGANAVKEPSLARPASQPANPVRTYQPGPHDNVQTFPATASRPEVTFIFPKDAPDEQEEETDSQP
jgi:hypothetical protein